MLNISEIIRRIYKDLSCPVCGKKYKVGELNVRSLVDHSLVLATVCSNGHATLFITTLNGHDETKDRPVSADDCINFYKHLKQFNGDFATLWKK